MVVVVGWRGSYYGMPEERSAEDRSLGTQLATAMN